MAQSLDSIIGGLTHMTMVTFVAIETDVGLTAQERLFADATCPSPPPGTAAPKRVNRLRPAMVADNSYTNKRVLLLKSGNRAGPLLDRLYNIHGVFAISLDTVVIDHYALHPEQVSPNLVPTFCGPKCAACAKDRGGGPVGGGPRPYCDLARIPVGPPPSSTTDDDDELVPPPPPPPQERKRVASSWVSTGTPNYTSSGNGGGGSVMIVPRAASWETGEGFDEAVVRSSSNTRPNTRPCAPFEQLNREAYDRQVIREIVCRQMDVDAFVVRHGDPAVPMLRARIVVPTFSIQSAKGYVYNRTVIMDEEGDVLPITGLAPSAVAFLNTLVYGALYDFYGLRVAAQMGRPLLPACKRNTLQAVYATLANKSSGPDSHLISRAIRAVANTAEEDPYMPMSLIEFVEEAGGNISTTKGFRTIEVFVTSVSINNEPWGEARSTSLSHECAPAQETKVRVTYTMTVRDRDNTTTTLQAVDWVSSPAIDAAHFDSTRYHRTKYTAGQVLRISGATVVFAKNVPGISTSDALVVVMTQAVTLPDRPYTRSAIALTLAAAAVSLRDQIDLVEAMQRKHGDGPLQQQQPPRDYGRPVDQPPLVISLSDLYVRWTTANIGQLVGRVLEIPDLILTGQMSPIDDLIVNICSACSARNMTTILGYYEGADQYRCNKGHVCDQCVVRLILKVSVTSVDFRRTHPTEIVIGTLAEPVVIEILDLPDDVLEAGEFVKLSRSRAELTAAIAAYFDTTATALCQLDSASCALGVTILKLTPCQTRTPIPDEDDEDDDDDDDDDTGRVERKRKIATTTATGTGTNSGSRPPKKRGGCPGW